MDVRNPVAALACAAALAAATLAGPARAARTELVVRPASPDTPYVARYSQGVVLEALLTSDGAPVNGALVPPLRVVFTLAPAEATDGGATDAFVIEDPVVDAAGVARARLTLVDGRFGGQQFQGRGTLQDEAFPYVVTAEFAGRNPPPLGDCQPDVDAGPPPAADGGAPVSLCASTDDGALLVTQELPSLVLDEVGEVLLGESVTLIAVLTDPNGDAPPAGNEVDGDGSTPIAGAPVTFYFDLDNNGSPSAPEALGQGTTDANGAATFTQVLDPQFFNAGEYQNGVHVQYAGDGRRYSLAGDSSRINVLALEPDPTRTIIEVDPTELPADGFSIATVTVKLVDADNGILDINAPAHDVALTTTLGTLVDDVERDPTTGFYTAELRAARAGGVATLAVTVDGAAGPTADVRMIKEGCACVAAPAGGDATTSRGAAVIVAAALMTLGARGRRRR